MLKLTGLYVYPIKSCKGIALDEMKLEKKGPQWDRRWMIVDEKGVFITQRKYPQMALISAFPEEGQLRIVFPEKREFCIPLQEEGQPICVEVWRDQCKAVDQGNQAAAILSSFLGVNCRLVFLPDHSVRSVDAAYAVSSEDEVGFADGFPLLLISEASLKDLNDRLDQPVPMNRFRPNLVISGCAAFDEDKMKRIRIGSLEFNVVKPCARCIVTTVDQSTGIRGLEPLQTLATYRKREKGVMFGQNVIHRGTGTLHLGDLVEVLEY